MLVSLDRNGRRIGGSFGWLDSEEESTWGNAMVLHRNLLATQDKDTRQARVDTKARNKYLELFPQLKPLGSRRQIERLLQQIVTRRRRELGGRLPYIYEVSVPGFDQPLMVPSEGLTASTLRAVDAAATDGIRGFEALLLDIQTRTTREPDMEIIERGGRRWLVDRRGDRPEAVELVPVEFETSDGEITIEDEEGGPVDPNTGEPIRGASWGPAERAGWAERTIQYSQQITAYTTLLNSIIQSAQSISEASGAYDVARAVVVLAGQVANGLSEVAKVLSSISSISAVCQVIGVVCAVLAAICEFLSYIIRYTEERYGPEGHVVDVGYKNRWGKTASQITIFDRLRILCQCEDRVLTRENMYERGVQGDFGRPFISGDERLGLYRWILKSLSYRPPGGVGRDPKENAALVCASLGGGAEAWRLIGEIQQWLLYIGATGVEADVVWWWLYESHKVTTVIEHQKKISESPHCDDRPNAPADCIFAGHASSKELSLGSPEWYRERRNLDIDRGQFRKFTIQDLRTVHGWLRRQIVITEAPQTEEVLLPGTVVKSAKPRLIGNARFEKRVVVGNYFVDAGRDVTIEVVSPVFRGNYLEVGTGSKRWGCVVGKWTDVVATARENSEPPISAYALSGTDLTFISGGSFASQLAARLNGGRGALVAAGLGVAAVTVGLIVALK